MLSTAIIYSTTGVRDTTIDNSKMKVTHLVVPGITNEIIRSGTVLVYFNFGGGIFPLPNTSSATGKTSTIAFHIKPGRILITRYTHDNTASVSLGTDSQYRYIIIPGGVRAQLSGVDLNDYHRVKAALGLID